MEREDLVGAIRRRSRLRSEAEARRVLEGVLQALAHVLPAEHRDAVCDCVPEDAIWCLRCGPEVPDPLIDSEVFLGWVMSSVETTGAADQTLGGEDPLAATAGDEARERVRVVLDELWVRLDESLVPAIVACLPAGVTEPAERVAMSPPAERHGHGTRDGT